MCIKVNGELETMKGELKENWLGLTKEVFSEEQRKDETWKELILYLRGGRVPGRKIPRTTLCQSEVLDDILYYVKTCKDSSLNYVLVIPRQLTQKAMEVSHDQSGHFGQFKSIHKAETNFYWPSLRSDMIKYIKECISCQQFKSSKGLSQQYRELPIVERPLQRVAIDITDMISGQDGFRYVLTIIDHFSRFVKFYPLKNRNASMIADKLSQYIAGFGVPITLMMDNAAEFSGQEMRRWAQTYGVELLFTTPYHPQANGLIERMHRTLKTVMAQLCKGYPLRWPAYLVKCQRLMNTAVHASTGVSPYEAFYARPPARAVTAQLLDVPVESGDIDQLRRVIRDASVIAQRRYRAVANRKRKLEKVPVGSLVWVLSEKTIQGTCAKLNPKWRGPYRVVESIRDGLTYVLEDPFTGKCVQRAAEKVKPYVSRSEVILEPEEELVSDTEEEEDRQPPPRRRQPPRRLIEEM